MRLSDYHNAISASGFAAQYRDSPYAEYGDLTVDALKVVLTVFTLEPCPPALLTHAWMNESSLRFYPEPNCNDKFEPSNRLDPDKWDHGPTQINRGLYRANVAVNWYRPLPEHLVFGETFFQQGEPCDFTGNPLFNVRAAAIHLNRITGSWSKECIYCGRVEHADTDHRFEAFQSLEEYKAGKYTGPGQPPYTKSKMAYRVKSWRMWRPILNGCFERLLHA